MAHSAANGRTRYGTRSSWFSQNDAASSSRTPSVARDGPQIRRVPEVIDRRLVELWNGTFRRQPQERRNGVHQRLARKPHLWFVRWIGEQVSASGRKVLPNALLVRVEATNAVNWMAIRRRADPLVAGSWPCRAARAGSGCAGGCGTGRGGRGSAASWCRRASRSGRAAA